MDYNTLVTEEEEQRLSCVPLTALYEALGQVTDGRKKCGCRYSLALLLTLLLLYWERGLGGMRSGRGSVLSGLRNHSET